MTSTEQARPLFPAVESTLGDAHERLRGGRLDDAMELFQSILRAEPNHAEANHGMGTLAVMVEQFGAALPYFAAALDADPQRASYCMTDLIDY